MKGRKPTPTRLRVLRGNPGKRKLPEAEPAPVASCALEAPEGLAPVALELWQRLAPALGTVGVTTSLDASALRLLCEAWADYAGASAVVARDGMTYETFGPSGSMVRARPEVAIKNDAWRRILAMMGEFGLTPSSRSRVSGAGGKPVDPFEEFLAGRA